MGENSWQGDYAVSNTLKLIEITDVQYDYVITENL